MSVLAASAMLAGCTTPVGAPSMTLLTRDPGVEAKYEPVASRVKRSECSRIFFLLVGTGTAQPTHEGAVARILEEHDADILLDAEMETSFLFLLAYIHACATVEGVPARLVAGR